VPTLKTRKREDIMKRVAIGLLSALCLAVTGLAAGAQDKFPSKPVKLLVPYAPGGATDIVARIVGEQMRQILGQSFVVENKPGAFGIIAIEEMTRARPDGYTLQIGNVSTNAITPVIVPEKMKINYERDVTPVSNLIDVPAFLVITNTNFPIKDVKELIDYAKKNPGKLRYGTVGAGSYPHYDFAYFAKRAGDLDAIAIHNKAGAAGVINDMVTGDTQAAFLNVASTAAMIRAGKIKPIAIVNHTRLPQYPDVPTMAEVGFAGIGTVAWNAMFAPAGTPRPILETIHKAAVREVLAKQNFNIVPSKSIDDAKAWLAGEIATWRKITAEVKIEAAE
jgi:tripartite-type tricarboxylate transporter receptor subunit TctC